MRWRVIVRLGRQVTAAEYRIVWRWLARWAAERGHPIGRAASDPSRLWFWPSAPRERLSVYQFAEVSGPPLDVDRVLAEQCEYETRKRASKPAGRPALRSTSSRYALGALRSAVDRVRSAAVGERNATLNGEAFALARLVADGSLKRGEIEEALASAAHEAGLADAEIRATLRSALDAGEREPRNILEDKNLWRPRVRSWRPRISLPWKTARRWA